MRRRAWNLKHPLKFLTRLQLQKASSLFKTNAQRRYTWLTISTLAGRAVGEFWVPTMWHQLNSETPQQLVMCAKGTGCDRGCRVRTQGRQCWVENKGSCKTTHDLRWWIHSRVWSGCAWTWNSIQPLKKHKFRWQSFDVWADQRQLGWETLTARYDLWKSLWLIGVSGTTITSRKHELLIHGTWTNQNDKRKPVSFEFRAAVCEFCFSCRWHWIEIPTWRIYSSFA